MQNALWADRFTVLGSKNMPAEHYKETARKFHEAHEQQSSNSVAVGENDLKSRFNDNPHRQPSTHRIAAWSSSSSSLSTGSLFSLTDSHYSISRRYKSTGILFDDLDPVPIDPEIDPEPHACYNCWHFDHEYYNCPDVKIHKYCRNCGRRGVVMKECPRCSRAYMDYLSQSHKQCNALFNSVQLEEPMDDVQLKVVEERLDENWDDFMEDHRRSPEASFSDSWRKRRTEYQHDDWDNDQSPRVNQIEKSSQLCSLYAAKAEVAKCKDDSWSDLELDSYSYSQGKYGNETKDASIVTPKKTAKYKVEDCRHFSQEACKDIYPSLNTSNRFKSSIILENERAEHESECWSNHDEEVLKNSCRGSLANSSTMNATVSNETKVENEDDCWSDCNEYAFKNLQEVSAEMHKADNIFSNGKANLAYQKNSWSNHNEDLVNSSETNFIVEYTEQNLNTPQSKNAEYKEEDWSDLEAFQSLQDSFCEESDIGDQMTALNSRVEEEYWTDFDDDYNSLQASYTEDYKSLNNTADDDNDCTNILAADTPNSEEESGFYDSFYVTRNKKSNELFSLIRNEKVDDLFAAKQSYDENVYQSNSLESSIGSQSDEEYFSHNEDADDYESMIIDENERSEPFPCAGQAVQEFLNLLDSLKHLPIQTQNVVVLHFISKQKEQPWQSQMQNAT